MIMEKTDKENEATILEKEFVQTQTGEVQSSLKENITKLARFGGFSFIEATVEGTQNINPEKKARKKIFLGDISKQNEREALINNLDLWIELLSSNENTSELITKCKAKNEKLSLLLKKNQAATVDTVKELERSYREIAQFYVNTGSEKLTNIAIVNASPEQIADLDNPLFIEYIANELRQNFDKLDLSGNYSLLVIPGYMGSKQVIDKWAEISHRNKVQLFTDFADLDQPDDVVEMFDSSYLAGGDVFRSHVSLSCNWPIGRNRYAELDESDDLRISPSASLAGKIYTTPMSQVTAGKKYGVINEVSGVAFPLKKSEISLLEKMGLIPMVNEYGSVMAFSAKTLFNGDNLGLQTYSVVRVFDYVTKVLFDFLNRRTFENWNSRLEKDIRRQIVNFLDSITGPDALIEKFKVIRFERDPENKDRIYLDINLTPYFPAKNYILKLEGTKGDDDVKWDSECNQE
ncbi:type VI secretion system contractile sheath protein TssC [Bacteroides faecium]|uniref:Type VI secretion system contractile sheath protein TssC n=2 Tax=Bacteroides faecium TaxID=2715212 RepID=A0A6H0KQM4_9BACE|nr:type VI secretion system contractile sheath protein TssC [Bacteroides faecium]